MSIYEKLTELENKNKPYVLAVVVKSEGSVPGKPGFKMIVEPDGSTAGTIGGGAIELQAIKEAGELFKGGKSCLKEYILSDEEQEKLAETEEQLPMMCSGKQWVYLEVHGGRPPVYVFGGGHVGQALVKFLSMLDYHTILVDIREEFADEAVIPEASEVIHADYIKYSGEFDPPEDAYAVVLTHGHKFDYDIIKNIFERKLKLKYLGVIASRKKAAKMIDRLKDTFGNDFDMSMLYTPVGLKIGGNTAGEIALSIAAQIQEKRYENDPAKKIF